MRIFGMIVLLFLWNTVGFSQGVIEGSVSSKQDNEPLLFANIVVTLPDGKILGASTDIEGDFSLSIEPGIYSVKASYVGYMGHVYTNVMVEDGGSVKLLFSLEDDIRIIACPVISDSKPFTVQRIYQEEIEKKNLGQDVPYLLKMTPSAVVTSDAGAGIGYTAIRVRGSDQTNINVTVNGIPLNDSESHQVYWVDLPDIMASADNIEIERGVGTSKNGAGAFGATINVSTKGATRKPSLTLGSTIGSFNTQKYSLEASTGSIQVDDNADAAAISFMGRVSAISSDGYIDRASSDLKSYFLSANYENNRSSLQLNTFSGHEITYQAWYGVPINYIKGDSLTTYNEAGQERSDKPHPAQVDNYKQTHYQAIYEGWLYDDIKINAALHYTKGMGYYEQFKGGQNIFKYGSDSVFVGGVSIEESDLIRRKWLDNDFYGGVFNIKLPVLDGLNIGGGWNEYIGQHFGKVIWAQLSGIPHGKEYYNNDAKKQDFNVFVNGNKEINKFNTYLDLQYRNIKYHFSGFDDEGKTLPQSVNHHFFNPKLGVSYSLNNNVLYATMAVAHREPNRSDYRSNPIGKQPKVERLIDYEAGVRNSIGDFQYLLNGFFMQYKNQLALTGKLTEVGEYARVNVSKSYRLGVEADVAYKANKWLAVLGNLTVSKNKIDKFTEHIDNWDTWEQETLQHENTNLAFSPNMTSALTLQTTFWDRRLGVSLTGKYVGKQYLDNTSNEATALGAYLYNDFQINYLFMKSKVSYLLNLKVNNLFNAKYSANGWAYRYRTDSPYIGPYDQLETGNTYSQVGLFPQAGINFLLGLVVKL